MNKILLAAALSLLLPAWASAQVSNTPAIGKNGASAPSYSLMVGFVDGAGNVQTASAVNPLPVNASITATSTIAALAPTGQASMTATNTTSNVALGSLGPTAMVTNNGSVAAYINFGTNTVTATTSGYPVNPGQTIAFSSGVNTYMAAITASGSAPLSVTSGVGLPAISGGGSGGGGGAITAASGAYASGSISAGAMVDIGTGVSPAANTVNARLAAINTTLGSPLQAGGNVAVTSSALPTGAATAANQTTANSSLSTIATNSGTQATAALQTSGNSSLSTIATNTTGIATSALQTTGNSSLSSIDTKTPALNGDGGAPSHVTNFPATQAVSNAGTFSVQCTSGCAGGGGSNGTDHSANKPTIPNVGANFAASGPYASYVLVATLAANSSRAAVDIENVSGALAIAIRDDGTATAGNPPANASVIALSAGGGTGQQGGSWSSTTFKGRIQVYAPSSGAFITVAED